MDVLNQPMEAGLLVFVAEITAYILFLRGHLRLLSQSKFHVLWLAIAARLLHPLYSNSNLATARWCATLRSIDSSINSSAYCKSNAVFVLYCIVFSFYLPGVTPQLRAEQKR